MQQVMLVTRGTRFHGIARLVLGVGFVWQSTLIPVNAQTTADSGASRLEEVVVTSRYEFLSADTSGTTNLPLPLEKVPQSISLVSDDFVKAADLKTLGDIAQYTPGALNTGNKEGYGTNIKLRGFPAAQAVDGVNVGVLSGVKFEPDYATMERLEVVKGPSSVIYGVSSAGGLVNFVTKSATRETPRYVSVQAGSWNTYRVEGQVAGAVNADETLRAIGIAVRDQGDSFTNRVSHGSTVVYGGVDWAGSSSLTGFLHGGYERHVRTSFDGIPTYADGSLAPVPRSFFIGSKNMELTTSVFHAESGLTWKLSDMLELSAKGNVRTSDTHGIAPFSYGLDSSGNLRLGIQDFESWKADDYGVGVSAVYHLDSFGFQDSFVSLATLYQDDVSDVRQGSGTFGGSASGLVNIFDGEAAIETALRSAVLTGTTRVADVETKTLTVSAQSVVQVVDHLSVLAGASYAKPKLTNTTNGVYRDYSPDGQMSYRAGVMYEYAPGGNAYVSFSQSFNPQTRIDATGSVLPPVVGEQYEGGVKYRSPGGRLLLTAAAFEITQKNQGQFYARIDGADRYQPIGELKHRGIELESVGRLSPRWQLNASYTYLDPKISKDSNPDRVGKTELFLPNQTAAIFSTYTIDSGRLAGLSVGGGMRYVGAARTSFNRSTQDIPSYVVADASVGYVIDAWSVQLNLHNLFDKLYLINNYDTLLYGNVVGAPFSAALTVRRDF